MSVTHNNVNQNSFVSLAEVGKKTAGSDLKAAAKGFFEEMASIMRDYADKDKSMTIMGQTVSGEDKYRAIGTTLISQYMTQNGNAIESILSIQNFINKIEQEMGKIS